MLVLAGAALVSYYGTWGVTAGDVVMLSAFLTPLTGLAPLVTKGLESVRSIGEVLQAPETEDNDGKTETTSVQGSVTFRQVDHAYDTGRATVRGFTLDVAPGEASVRAALRDANASR